MHVYMALSQMSIFVNSSNLMRDEISNLSLFVFAVVGGSAQWLNIFVVNLLIVVGL